MESCEMIRHVWSCTLIFSWTEWTRAGDLRALLNYHIRLGEKTFQAYMGFLQFTGALQATPIGHAHVRLLIHGSVLG